MDINNLETFSPKKKKVSVPPTIPTIPTSQEKEVVKKQVDPEFKSYGQVSEMDEMVIKDKPDGLDGSDDKISIDFYTLSKNCKEYILLNNKFLNNDLKFNPPEWQIKLELEKRNYIKNSFDILNDYFHKKFEKKEYKIETSYYRYKELLFNDFEIYSNNIYNIPILDIYLNDTNLDNLNSTNHTNIIFLKTNKIENYINTNYCKRCFFNKICEKALN